ncbi:MAG: DUF488 family protein [Longimicrobiales bacterium]
MTTVYTVGHSTREQAELVALLHAHGIRALVDVRRFPGSRRYPQFARDALSRWLPEAGIEYHHEADLGGRRKPDPASPNTAWRNAGFRAYADHMSTGTFRDALGRLVERAAVVPTAVMCAEAVPWRCHRRLIADALVAEGHEVRHILSLERADAHALNEFARRVAGRLVYPGTAERASGRSEQLDLGGD